MAKEDVSKIKDIANHFCNMSLDEILKLPNPEGYEFVDRFFDQAFQSQKTLEVVKEN